MRPTAIRQIIIRRAKSIAGAVLVTLGVFIFYDRAAALLSHPLDASSGEALGFSVVLAASRVVKAYAADHHRFLREFGHQMLCSCLPLLLVIAGTALSRDGYEGDRGSGGVE
jgi:hypothetical protein